MNVVLEQVLDNWPRLVRHQLELNGTRRIHDAHHRKPLATLEGRTVVSHYTHVGKRDDESQVAAIQLSAGSDVKRNVDEALRLVDEAADRGAQYVQLPEYFNFLGPSRDLNTPLKRFREPPRLEWPNSRSPRPHAPPRKSSGEVPIDGKFYNTSVVINPNGEIIATYRKVHLFDVNVPGRSSTASRTYCSRRRSRVVRFDEFCLGLSVCFDVRFPDLYRNLAPRRRRNRHPGRVQRRHGSRPLGPVGSGPGDREPRLRRRRGAGRHDRRGNRDLRHSLIVDPWGEVLGEATSAVQRSWWPPWT